MASVLYPSLGLSGSTGFWDASTHHNAIYRNDRDLTGIVLSYLSSYPATRPGVSTHTSSSFLHCKLQKPFQFDSLDIQAPLNRYSTPTKYVPSKPRQPEVKSGRIHGSELSSFGTEMHVVNTRPFPPRQFNDHPGSILGSTGVPNSGNHLRYANHCICQPNSCRKFKRRNQPIEVGNNKEGRKGKLRCDACRKNKSKVSS